ncbi:MAG: hypothetical protein Q7S27_05900 [Nanoarchaeota archaeon]|nr:hypothetical protein [Nanoarchaeota archaeon]
MAKKKTRVNISVDKELLDKAKTKLTLFGGKLSTLFNAFLADFVETMGKDAVKGYNILEKKMNEIEQRVKKFEDKFKK